MKELIFKKPAGIVLLAGLIFLDIFVDTDLRALNFLMGFGFGLSIVIACVNLFELSKSYIYPIKSWYQKDIFEVRIK